MQPKRKKTDKRAYTFMIVPHRGDRTYSLDLPAVTLKRAFAAVLCVLFVFGAFQVNQIFVLKKAESEQAELSHLRSIKDEQENKLKQLAKATEEVQQELVRVGQLENDVRRSLGADEKATVSRSGVDRTLPGQEQRVGAEALNVDELIIKAQQLKAVAAGKQDQLVSLNEQLVARNAVKAATPSGWPASGDITSRFGPRSSPGGMGSSFHKGIDIAGAYGSTVTATADGVVEEATWFGGYGMYVFIDHGYGMKTAYAHNSALLVSAGQKVTKGQPIARMGNSGVSTGTHLHYEVHKNGVQVNPAGFI